MGRTWKDAKAGFKRKPSKKDRRELEKLDSKPLADRYTMLRREVEFVSSYKKLKIEE